MNQPVKPPGKNTPTWRLYEALFFKKDAEYPILLTDLPRGRAINTAMMLNKCNVRYFQSLGAPDEAITLSAKAKQNEKGEWYVEISRNFKRQGENSPTRGGKGNWMDALTERVSNMPHTPPAADIPASPEGVSLGEARAEGPAPAEADAQEDLINKMYGM